MILSVTCTPTEHMLALHRRTLMVALLHYSPCHFPSIMHEANACIYGWKLATSHPTIVFEWNAALHQYVNVCT